MAKVERLENGQKRGHMTYKIWLHGIHSTPYSPSILRELQRHGAESRTFPPALLQKGEQEMAAVLSQTTLDARVKQGQRRHFGRHHRFLLVSLIALAFFGIVSAATPKEALAAGTGWYWTLKSDGQQYNCYWIYHGTDAYGNAVWTQDGCKFYFNAQLPTYYRKYTTNQTLVMLDGYWWDVASFWRSTSFSQTVVTRPNTAGYALLQAQVNQTLSVGLASTRSATKASTSSESLRVREAYPGAEAVRAPKAGQVTEAFTDSKATPDAVTTADTYATSSDFPWKVCQDDNSKCMRYGEDAWRKVSTSKAQGGTYRVSSSKTRGAFFAAAGDTDAAGSTMQLTTATGPKMGKAKVLVVNLAKARIVKKVTFDLRSSNPHFKVAKNISGLTPHIAYGLVVLSADGRKVAVDSVGYEAHDSTCHNVL
jgi:hypothetical protein